MKSFSDMAKKYNMNVEKASALYVISTPVKSEINVDIGFGRSEKRRVTPFKFYNLCNGLYAYGDGAAELTPQLKSSQDLCEKIKHILSEYAFSVEWVGKHLITRINSYYLHPNKDLILSEWLLVELRGVADALAMLDVPANFYMGGKHFSRGPGWLRNKITTIGMAIPFIAIAIIMMYAFHNMANIHIK
ncbi:hypothetical protein [Burkholderia ubonensis]|uniref:hypothetical protein n=1 Tax=Burkholderia ubonensis TaxID=101571 RepID=UPI0018DF97B8|nr:hypothetical protein [Burkholderia ubonensis]